MHEQRAVIYVRQSRDRQGTGLAVERQRSACAELAEKRGWTIIKVITDNDVSATSGAPRPGFDRLLQLVDDHAVDVIVCWHVDRLVRRLADLEDVIERCEKANVRLATVSGDLDLSTDAGRLVGRILASVAKGEMERKSARQRAQARQAAESGKPPARRAFGFAPGGMELHPTEAPAVRDAYAALLAGGADANLAAITRKLNADGFSTTSGKPWRRTSVRELLLSARNCGIRVYQRQEVAPGAWPGIVSEEVFREAQRILTDPGRRTQQGTARKWLGGGLYTCVRCGSDMVVAYRDAANSGTRLYTCRRHRHLSRPGEPVDALVRDMICARLRDPAIIAAMSAEAPEVPELRDEAAKLRRQLDKLAEDYADGLLTARQVKISTDRIEARLEIVTRDIAAAGRAARLSPVATAEDPCAAWLELDVNAQRVVIDTLAEVVLHPGRSGSKTFRPESVEFRWRI